MRKITALLLLAVFVLAGCAAAKTSTYERSIQRSNEAHRELERSVQP